MIKLILFLVGLSFNLICFSQVIEKETSLINYKKVLPECKSTLKDDLHNCQIEFEFPSTGMKYIGEFRNGERNGQGVLYLQGGRVYSGNWVNGSLTEGLWEDSTGEKYFGEFKGVFLSGNGTFTRKNGEYYIGAFKDNKPNGFGVYHYKKDYKYIGEFKNGLREGTGIFFTGVSESYQGEFKNNLPHGYGIYNYPDGTIYIGYRENGIPNGEGKLMLPDGKSFTGRFENGKTNGMVKISEIDGNEYFIKHLNGEPVTPENCIESIPSNEWNYCKGFLQVNGNNKYVGLINNGKPDGKGMEFDKEGKVVVRAGIWKNGLYIRDTPVIEPFFLKFN